jgi:hypothetical protein
MFACASLPICFTKKKAGIVIAPIAVVEIPGNDDEGDFLFDRLGNEVLESNAGRAADAFGGSALLPGQPLERTVEMDVARVNEAKRLQD